LLTPVSLLLLLLLQDCQQLLPVLSLPLHPCQAAASQQQQLLYQQLRTWCHNM
jgi:hypothetical protein